jgi:hypothetical protein
MYFFFIKTCYNEYIAIIKECKIQGDAMANRKTYEDSYNDILFGDNIIPDKNPKKFECNDDDLIREGYRIIGIKGIKFTCDNCSSPMNVIRGPYGFFIGCHNWKKSDECKKNTITLTIKKSTTHHLAP